MKRITIFILILGLMLALVIGCGEDEDEVVTPTTLETGDLEDPGLLLVQNLILGSEDFEDSLWNFLDEFVDTVIEDSASLAAAGKLPGVNTAVDSAVVAYHGTSEYWYRYVRHIDTLLGQGQEIEEIVTFVLEDSIQFREGDVVVQWPDTADLTGVATGGRLTINTLSGVGNVSAGQNLTLVGDIVDQGDVTVNGTRDFSLGWSDQSGACSAEMDVDAVGTDIVMNITSVDQGGCPASGSLLHEGTITLGCTGDTAWSYSDTWVISQVFHGDSTVVHIENSTTQWDYVDHCDGGGPIAKSFEELMAALKPRD